MQSAAIILMGGKSSRLGGLDKGDIKIGGVRNFDRVHQNLAQTFDDIALSVAPDSVKGKNVGWDLIVDYPSSSGRGGAAFAILACLFWAQEQSLDFVLTTPVDTPFLPTEFAAVMTERFMNSDRTAPIAAQTGERLHNLHGVWPVICLPALKSLLLDERIYKMQRIHEALNAQICPFAVDAYDPFFNINTPIDLKGAHDIAARHLPD